MYNASSAVVAQVSRSRWSSCPSYGLLLTDQSPDSVAHDVAVHGLSINPRFLLYNYYLRQSSLIYWSPARTLLAVRRPCLSRYSRLALLDGGGFGLSCSPLRLAREERCVHGCCCCGCRSSSNNFGEEVIELLADGGGFCHGDIDFHFPDSKRECCNDDYDRFEHPRKSWRKEVETGDGNRKKERYSRSKRGGSSRTCRSCGSNHIRSSRRRRCYEEVDSFEEEDYDDAVSVTSTEMEYRWMDDNVKASSARRRTPQREGRHKKGGHASSSYRSREDYDSEVEEITEHQNKSEVSQRIGDIHEDYVAKTSRSNNVIASRIMDKEKGLTLSRKQHREVGRRWGDEKMETRGASSRVSGHSMREEYGYDKQNVVGQRDSKEGSSQKFVRLVDVYEDEDDTRRSSNLNKFDKSKSHREESSLLTTKQHNQVDQVVTRRADHRMHNREEHASDEDRLLRRRETREGSHKSAKIFKANENDVTMMSSLLTAKQHNQVDQEAIRRADLRRHHREEHVSDEDRLLRQRETREGSRKSTRISKVNENDFTRISRINNIIDSRKVDQEELLTSTLKQHSEIDEHASGKSQSRSNLQNYSDLLEVYNQKLESTSNTRRHYEKARLNNKNDNYTSVKVAIDDRTHVDEQVVDRSQPRSNMQNYSDVLEVDNQKLESTSNTRRRYEKARLNNKNDNYTSVKVAIDDKTHVDEQVVDALELNKQYGSHHVSGANVRSNEIGSSSQSLLGMRVDDRNSTSTFGLTHESVVQENLTDRKSTQESNSRRETKGYSISSQLSRLGDNKTLNTEVNNMRVKNDLSDNKFSSTRKSEVYAKRFDFSNDGRKNDFDAERISNRQRETLKESSQLMGNELPLIVTSDDQTNSGRMVIKGDMLDSATQMERSSAMYIREFVDKAQQEPSNSQIRKKKEEIHPGSTDASCATITSGDAVIGHSLEEDARISSFQSKTERQLDEMWDVNSPTSQGTLKMEPPQEETSSPGILDNKISLPATDSVNTHSSPRSLWSLLTCITRMGWSNHDESHASTGKSGKRSSSADSIRSEAWFPGQELDDSEDETDNRGNSTSKGPLLVNEPVDLSHIKSSSRFGQTSSETKVKGQMIMSEGATVSTSMDILQGGSVSIGVPLSMIQGGSIATGTPSMGTIQDGSGSNVSPTGFRPEGNLRTEIGKGTGSMLSSETPSGRYPVISGASLITAQEAITSGDVPLPACDFTKMEENLITEESPESKKIEGKEGELKRRKLQRSQQVLKERFEAWEEACRIETEQRKIDEHFMREALAEAQKAADTWEVPVGAVLVHDGKIIARGFNLVEKLRDSTAHAEMICIREASNILRTWRLAGTTLYVTLEPCPMCAGAILQARVDTVVWGAPNKLLGADGSWVRLFPGGERGSSSLDPSDQLAGPIHPFHSKIIIRRGVLATECSEVMQQFFKLRRKEEKKQESTPPSCQPMPTYPIKFFTKMNPLFSLLFCLY